MAGHSKWANIQHRKGRQDAARSKLFSKLAKEITVAAKMGDPDPDKNPRLRLAVKEAKSNSVPKDVIQRAIDKSQAGDGDNYEEIRYEGYGPGGVAVIVEAMTDNKNRTASTVRSTFTKNGGNLAETGAVSFMFDRKGQILYPADAGTEDDVMEAAIEAGAEDVESSDDGHVIFTEGTDLNDVSTALEAALGEARVDQINLETSDTYGSRRGFRCDADEVDRHAGRRRRHPERHRQFRDVGRGDGEARLVDFTALALSDNAYGSRMACVWLAYGRRMYKKSMMVARKG